MLPIWVKTPTCTCYKITNGETVLLEHSFSYSVVCVNDTVDIGHFSVEKLTL